MMVRGWGGLVCDWTRVGMIFSREPIETKGWLTGAITLMRDGDEPMKMIMYFLLTRCPLCSAYVSGFW